MPKSNAPPRSFDLFVTWREFVKFSEVDEVGGGRGGEAGRGGITFSCDDRNE